MMSLRWALWHRGTAGPAQRLAARQKCIQDPRAMCLPLPPQLGPLQHLTEHFSFSFSTSSPSPSQLPQQQVRTFPTSRPSGWPCPCPCPSSHYLSSVSLQSAGIWINPRPRMPHIRYIPRFPLWVAGGRNWPKEEYLEPAEETTEQRVMN